MSRDRQCVDPRPHGAHVWFQPGTHHAFHCDSPTSEYHIEIPARTYRCPGHPLTGAKQ